MGAARKMVQKKAKLKSFQLIQGGKTDSPAEDYLVFQAYDSLKNFVQFFPYHIQTWGHLSSKQMDELNKQKLKNQEDYRYFNFF